MSDFKRFQEEVWQYGGVWSNKEDVYFSQMRDNYCASYLPEYPNKSEKDCTLNYNHMLNMWSD